MTDGILHFTISIHLQSINPFNTWGRRSLKYLFMYLRRVLPVVISSRWCDKSNWKFIAIITYISWVLAPSKAFYIFLFQILLPIGASNNVRYRSPTFRFTYNNWQLIYDDRNFCRKIKLHSVRDYRWPFGIIVAVSQLTFIKFLMTDIKSPKWVLLSFITVMEVHILVFRL